MTGLDSSTAEDFTFLPPRYGEPGCERWDRKRQGNQGVPGVDAYPRLDANGLPTLVSGETALGGWTATSLEVLRKQTRPAARDAGWVRLEEAPKAKCALTLTNRRLIIILSEESLTNRFGQRPSRRSKLAMKALARVSPDLMSLEVLGGHIPLEGVRAVGIRRNRGTSTINVLSSVRSTTYEATHILKLALRQGDATALAALLGTSAIERWLSYDLPDRVRRALIDAEAPAPGGSDEMTWDAPFFKPAGSRQLVLSKAAATNDRMPKTLVAVGTVVREHEPEPERLADVPPEPWTCPECGHAGNPSGRVRCVQCRREVGHLATD